MRPTPILSAAEAPTVSTHELTVYLLTTQGNELVRRTRSYTGAVNTATAINLLVAGPSEEEKKLGLTTEVPGTTSPVYADANLIVLPADMGPLSKMAQFQLYCTAIASRAKLEGVPLSGVNCP